MRVLLDTNIVIHRESSRVINEDIGLLFQKMDALGYEKIIHPIVQEEIGRHPDPAVLRTMSVKLSAYRILKTVAPILPEVQRISALVDTNPNDVNDTALLNELCSQRVDYFITEDRKIHRKADDLGVDSRVFTIESFLEKIRLEEPTLVSYPVLSVVQKHFGEIDVANPFFDSFRVDYPGFDGWFNRKSDEIAYVCYLDDSISAFLYLKVEGLRENYSDVVPILPPKKRLKIGTFKVVSNGYRLGERFIKIAFDNAIENQVDEIYVTIFDNESNKLRLVNLLEEWGFNYFGKKGSELVLTRSVNPAILDTTEPKKMFPFIKADSRKWIGSIYPSYHTDLLPDSILNNEEPVIVSEARAHRNALSKVFISRSFNRDLSRGDVLVFYRTKSGAGPAWYTSVATTVGVVESVIDNIPNEEEFIKLCRKRSVFDDDSLREHWNWNSRYRPFIINFLYVYSFTRRPNLKELKEHGIIAEAPRGFDELSNSQFEELLRISHARSNLVVN